MWIHNKKFHEKKPKVKEYICKQCKKSFDNKQNKYYHQKNCKSDNTVLCNVPITKDTNITTINNNSTITNSNNNINNGTINKTIIINNYNNDNLEYISEKFKDKLFKALLDEEEYNFPLPKLIENIKFIQIIKKIIILKLKAIDLK